MYPPTVCSTPYEEKACNCQGKFPPEPSPSQAEHHQSTELKQQLSRNEQHSPFPKTSKPPLLPGASQRDPHWFP